MNAEATSTSTELTLLERAQVALQSPENEKKLRELAQASKSITAITNKAGYEQCHSARMALKRQRIEIEQVSKTARDDAQKFSKACIAEERRLIGLIQLEEERLQALQEEWDAARERERQERIEAERKRVAAIQERIDGIRQEATDAATETPAQIEQRIQRLVALVIDGSFAELAQQAEAARETTLVRLRLTLNRAVEMAQERRRLVEERERLARERAEEERRQAEERARIAEEERQAKAAREEAARLAREALEAEQRRLAEEEQRLAAERARQREEDARLEAQRAEAERIERERREQLDAEERRIAAEREQIARDQEAARQQEEQRMREAAGGAPAGAAASESGDSNIANESAQVPADLSSASGPEATSLQGCELCGDFPTELHARCHPTAPLRMEMISATEVVVRCYVPTCNREVTRLYLRGTLIGEAASGKQSRASAFFHIRGVNTVSRFIKIAAEGQHLPEDAPEWVAVLDIKTNLMWTVAEIKKALPWKKAQAVPAKLETAGFKDWRMPTVEELFLLADRTRTAPAIDTAFFPNCHSDWYWSSTPFCDSPGVYAWYVYFGSGYSGWLDQSSGGFVRAVRAGQS